MAKNLILSKESNEEEIKRYFEAVLKLAQSANEFPINLDEVWMLVYNRKDYATDALKKDFIEGIDYICTSVKTEVGSVRFEYYITVSCLEFFIARKVRAVFEVYRKVFHGTARIAIEQKKPKREPTLTTKVRVGLEWVKGVSEILNLSDSSKLSLLGKVAKPLNLPVPDYAPSKGITKSATTLLKENKVALSARKFNEKLLGIGFLQRLERKSSKGIKTFLNLTKEGLAYGENVVSPQNPNETQPHFYQDTFSALLSLLGLQPSTNIANEN